MKKMLKRYDILFTVFLFLLVIPAEYYEWFSGFENQTLSLRHVMRNTLGNKEKIRFPSEKIALVVQDEQFFEEYGSFPLRRVGESSIPKSCCNCTESVGASGS